MSGVGKSTALAGLARRGCVAVDTDDGPWIEIVSGERLWRETLIEKLLDRPRDRPLFVAGTVANQVRCCEWFDAIVLLSAPTEVVLDRLERRTNNPFGKTADQRSQILVDIAEVEPLLRQAATHEIDTSATISVVVDLLAGIAGA